MKHKLLLTLLLLAGAGMAKAEIVEIGSGATTTVQTLPVYCYYNYSLAQQIYTASEIGRSGTIKSISFYNASSYAITRLVDFYMTHTKKQTFASGDSWENVTSSDKVFSGTVTFIGCDWTTITLDTPFEYNGTDNLAVLADDNTGSYVNAVNFRAFETSGCQGIEFHQDAEDANANNLRLYVGTMQNVKNAIRLDIGEGGSGHGPNTGVIKIGSGTDTSYKLPTSVCYNYSLSQQIYTKEEMGGAATLTSVSFYDTEWEMVRDVDIYLVHTGKTSFNNDNDWIGFSEADKVFSGQCGFYMDQWTTIAFDTPFAYNGTDNLALIVDDNTGGWVGNIDFRVFEAVNQSIYVNSDDINFTAAGLSGYVGTRGNSKNQVRFNAPDVPMLTSIDVTDITAHTALVTWESEGSLWNLQYRQGTSGAWTDVKGISSKSYALTNLDALTIYYVRVQIAGSPSDEGWTLTAFKTADGLHAPSNVEVSTTPTSATLSWEGNADSYTVSYRPYSGIIFYDDFENGLDAKGWTVRTLGDSPSGDGWFTMSPDNLGLKDANDDMIYAVSGSQVASAWSYYYGSVLDANNWLITPQVELKGTLRFMAVSNPLYLDSYEVLLSTTGNDTGDFTTVLRSMDVASGVWEPVSIDLSAFEGQQGYIAIHHVGVDKYVLFIDDFCISEGDADVATQQPWTGIGTTEKTLTIDGLWPATKYEYMITASGNGDMAETGIATFTTMESNPVPFDLAAVAKRTSATLSWTGFSDKYKVQYRKAASEVATFFEDFEDDLQGDWYSYEGAEGDGWQFYNTGAAISGNTVLASLSWNPSTEKAVDADNWLISPCVDLGSTLKFWIASVDQNYLDSYEVRLSLSEDINDIDDFNIVLQPLQEADNDWTEVSIDLSAYQGEKGYIAIRHKSYDCLALLLDDFGIYVSSGSQGEWKTITTKETEVTINGLEEETTYEFRVTGVKSGEADAVSDIASFSTRIPINLRLYADAEAMNSYRIKTNNGAFANVTIYDLTLKKDGRWWGFCLPFDLEVAGSILDGADVRTAENVWMKDPYLIIDCLTPVTKIRAGVPYIIKWDSGEDIIDPVFKEVVINKEAHDISLYDEKVSFNTTYNFGYDYRMNFYVIDGYLSLDHLALQDVNYPFRSYFWVDADLNETIEGVGLNVGNIDETMVGISLTPALSEGKDAIYNLSGQRLSKMQKGINIVNGRKVLMK